MRKALNTERCLTRERQKFIFSRSPYEEARAQREATEWCPVDQADADTGFLFGFTYPTASCHETDTGSLFPELCVLYANLKKNNINSALNKRIQSQGKRNSDLHKMMQHKSMEFLLLCFWPRGRKRSQKHIACSQTHESRLTKPVSSLSMVLDAHRGTPNKDLKNVDRTARKAPVGTLLGGCFSVLFRVFSKMFWVGSRRGSIKMF